MTQFAARILIAALFLSLAQSSVAHAMTASAALASPPMSRTMSLKAYHKQQRKQQLKTLRDQEKAQKRLEKLRSSGH